MKKSLFFMGLLLLLLTTGCGTVVYRINPDSLPQMSASEAKDTIELSFTLINMPQRFENVKVSEDVIDFLYPLSTSTGTARGIRYKVDYDKIDHEVIKQGNSYTAVVSYSSPFGSDNILLSWKSEEDARNFVNAAYVLRKKKFPDRKLAHTATAPAHPVPSEKLTVGKGKSESIKAEPPDAVTKKGATVVAVQAPREQTPSPATQEKAPPIIAIVPPVATAPAHPAPSEKLTMGKGKSESIKAEPPDAVTKEGTAVAAVQAPREQAPATATQEKIMPNIVIISPNVTRAVSVIPKTTYITVAGIAESSIGIMDVSVNNKQAALDEKGNFSVRIPLRVGRNDITVTAIDVRENKATKQFSINRESGKMLVEKKPDEVTPETGILSSKYYALIIAVQDYDSPEINKLDHPVNDAIQLRETLVTNYTFERENVKFLQNPDRKAIYKSLQNLKYRLTENDNLLIFYAGHGTWMDDMRQGYWLPKDASGVNDPSDWIPNSNIRDYIKAIKAKHILLVADACFSGGMFKVRTAFSQTDASVEKIYELSSRKAITSGSLKTVPDRSVFVEFLVKRLKDNREPYLDTQKLFISLREAVINNSPTKQTPLYGAINETGDEGGDFVFVRRRQ